MATSTPRHRKVASASWGRQMCRGNIAFSSQMFVFVGERRKSVNYRKLFQSGHNFFHFSVPLLCFCSVYVGLHLNESLRDFRIFIIYLYFQFFPIVEVVGDRIIEGALYW